MANSFRFDVYRSSSAMGYIAAGLLALICFLSILLVFFSFVHLAFPFFGFETETGELFTAGFLGVGLLELAQIPLRLLTAVFFLIWIYQAFRNLSPLKARNLEFSPGWAVGWWFIPFANLLKPFQVVRELFNESDPDFDPETGFLNTVPGTPFEIGLWWATLLISGIGYRISDMIYGKGDMPESDSWLVVYIPSAILAGISSGYAVYIVHNVIQRQDRRFQKISEGVSNPSELLQPGI